MAQYSVKVMASSPGRLGGAIPAREDVRAMSASQDLYVNAEIFTAAGPLWASAMLVQGERVSYVGDVDTARRIGHPDVREIDLNGAMILPGFIDAHAHVLATGQAEERADLVTATDLAEIQRKVTDWAHQYPNQPRVLAQGWLYSSVPEGSPTRQMLDAAVADRPVYALANDHHSIWLNTAALAELGIGSGTPDPPGGKIVRDAKTGEPTGHIDETAMDSLVLPFLDAAETDADRDRHLEQTLARYREAGVTGATDMGLDETALAAMSRAEQGGTLTSRICGHWLIQPTGSPEADLAQVARAKEVADLHGTSFLRVTGIKTIIDGTVDGCTAALSKPYANGSLPGPIWDLPTLAPVVIAADAAGLQVAMHAIGDEAIRVALSAIEAAVRTNGPKPRRHRIEHLEVVGHAEIIRLAALGITASMQPVHADPAIQANWRAVLGDERVSHGYPWPELSKAGATLAFGTDSPTAPLQPLPNMYIATTRRSAFDASLEPNIGRLAVPLVDAIKHTTHDAAWACRAENDQGQLAGGMLADFCVIDRNIFTADPCELLSAQVLRTVLGGRAIYQA
jgi:predicted amidohydrolase YtcJ